MHLEDHMHQLAVYMKRKNRDFPDTLLQQFNFQTVVQGTLSVEAEAKSEKATESEEEQ